MSSTREKDGNGISSLPIRDETVHREPRLAIVVRSENCLPEAAVKPSRYDATSYHGGNLMDEIALRSDGRGPGQGRCAGHGTPNEAAPMGVFFPFVAALTILSGAALYWRIR